MINLIFNIHLINKNNLQTDGLNDLVLVGINSEYFRMFAALQARCQGTDNILFYRDEG